MEGPQFSTRAESELHRSWGMDVIGMTAIPEAKLALEAELCYVCLALVTDYDCWHPDEASVTGAMVAETMQRNIQAAQQVLAALVAALPTLYTCSCQSALAEAIFTDPATIDPEVRARLDLVVGRYLPAPVGDRASSGRI